MRSFFSTTIIFALVASTVPAFAQAPQSRPQSVPEKQAPAPDSNLGGGVSPKPGEFPGNVNDAPAEKQAPPLIEKPIIPPGTDLSDRLDKSDGVIKPPPSRDTDIIKPTPDIESMPVIRPPGSPGGRTDEIPK